MTGEPRGFSRVTAGFSSYDGEFRLPLVLAQAPAASAAPAADGSAGSGPGGGAGGGARGGGSDFPGLGDAPTQFRPARGGPEQRRWQGCKDSSSPLDGDIRWPQRLWRRTFVKPLSKGLLLR